MENINFTIVFAVLWAISEGLAEIPGVKANSVFQACMNVLGFFKDKFGAKDPAAK